MGQVHIENKSCKVRLCLYPVYFFSYLLPTLQLTQYHRTKYPQAQLGIPHLTRPSMQNILYASDCKIMFKVCKSKKNISDFYTNILRVQHKGEFHKIVFPGDVPCLCVGKQLQSQNLIFSDYLRMQMSQVRLLFNEGQREKLK